MNTIDEVLSRGVAEVLPTKKALAELMGNKKITLYQGFDPSMPDLHIGNFVGVRKLAQFQKLGHKVIFLVGDFTGLIGDPTDKSAARKKLTRSQTTANARGWKKQIERVINFDGENKAELKFNSKWLSKLSFEDVIELASRFTVAQMLERDFFRDRIKREKPIHLHEFLYPLMQGYDSVAMDVDLEIGGTDQTFNMLAGRTLMKAMKGKEKFVLTMKLLEDPTGKKMGKTEGNVINLTDSPENIYGKIMAFPDTLVTPGIELMTDLPMREEAKKSPLDAKKSLAFEVVKQIRGEKDANKARAHFETTFQNKSPTYKKSATLRGTLKDVVSNIVGSKTEAKRLIVAGAVDINESVATDPTLKLKSGDKLKIGKKIFIRIK